MCRLAESDEKATKLAEDEVRKHQEQNKEKLRREAEAKEKIRKTLLKQQEEEEIGKQKNLKVFANLRCQHTNCNPTRANFMLLQVHYC